MAGINTYGGYSLEQMLAYLDERLPAAEAAQIDQLIEEDDLFAQALEEVAKAKRDDPAALARFDAMRDSLVRGAKKQVVVRKPLFQQTWTSYAIAAAIALLVAFVGFQFFGNQLEPDFNQVLSEYTGENGHYAERVGVRGSETDEALANALKAYTDKSYQTAIPLLEKVVSQPDSISPITLNELQLCLAISYWQQKSYAQADVLFAQLTQKASESRQQQAATWYFALSLLQQDKREEAQSLLNDLAASSGKHQQAAKKLLDAME